MFNYNSETLFLFLKEFYLLKSTDSLLFRVVANVMKKWKIPRYLVRVPDLMLGYFKNNKAENKEYLPNHLHKDLHIEGHRYNIQEI